jgi:hypothetical protein
VVGEASADAAGVADPNVPVGAPELGAGLADGPHALATHAMTATIAVRHGAMVRGNRFSPSAPWSRRS